jgi:predicted deacylase
LRGNIVAVPILSPLAYQAQLMNTPQDGYDLNRHLPGKPQMFLSHRLAHLIYHGRLWPCDYVIDPHANSSPAVRCAIVKGTADQTIKDISRELADAFGITTIEMVYEHEKHRTGTMVEGALADGKLCLVLELLYQRRIDENFVRTGVRGILNVLRKLQMIDGEIEEQTDMPVIEQRLSRVELTAKLGGLVSWFKTAGEAAASGAKVGLIRGPWGDVVKEIYSPRDGWMLAWPLLANQAATAGDFLASIAMPWTSRKGLARCSAID